MPTLALTHIHCSYYLFPSCSAYITRNILLDHELRESLEFIGNAIHPHSCYLCNSCSTYITRNFYLNTNYPNRPNPLQTPFIRIRVICVIRVQHISRGIFCLTTNYPNRPNLSETSFIRIRVICVIRVQPIFSP